MTTEQRLREWWIVYETHTNEGYREDVNENIEGPDTGPSGVQVVEKSAYTQLLADAAELVKALGKVRHAIANAEEWFISDPQDTEMDRDQQIGNWIEKALDETREALAQWERREG